MPMWRIGLVTRHIFNQSKHKYKFWNICCGRSRYFCFSARLRQFESGEHDTCSRNIKKSCTEYLLENSVVGVKTVIPDISKWSKPAYPECELAISQAGKRLQPDVDSQETCVVLFPGQGSQYVGMGRNLKHPEAKYLCDVASNFLGYDLIDLCASGPPEKLNRTEFSQMAVFVLSYAAAEQWKHEQPGAIKSCIATAGFSVGEITSLVFSGAISFTEALKLVKVRSEAMQTACNCVQSGMITVFYGPDSSLEYACLCAVDWCTERGIENPVCRIANYLFPHCKTIAGNLEALNFIEQNASRFKLKRLKRIPVSGAFHTPLMKPAAEQFKKALKSINIKLPKIPVYSNVDGAPYKSVRHILQQLPKQIYKPVKWEQTLHVLFERTQGESFPHTYECGPGSGLKSYLKMVNAKAGHSCTTIPV